MADVVYGDFEWDDAKAAANLVKHGVSFEEAATVFSEVKAALRALVAASRHVHAAGE